MTQEEIIEGNKLIALFMGYEETFEYHTEGKPVYIEPSQGECSRSYFSPIEDKDFRHLSFHSSWDWLMPVIEKIADTTHAVNICAYAANDVSIETWIGETIAYRNENKGSLLSTTYTTVVEFIKWYNKKQIIP